MASSVQAWYQSRGRLGTIALAFAVISGLVTHAYHLFDYPLYSTDEGIYVERAWAIVREGRLTPQTYIYDHAPAGWLVVAAWVFLLPGHFETFGNPVNSGRVLMLFIHVGSTFLLFEIARKLSGGLLAPVIATFFFNFSWLAIYYQREVLLDNIMVFWLLLSIYLLLREDVRLFTGLWSGLAFGMAVMTKENAIFFAPTVFYLLSRRIQEDYFSRHFTMFFWLFSATTPVLAYSLYATLNDEMLPPGLSFDLNRTPHGHVSLLYEMWFQINRHQSTLFDRHGPDPFLYTAWLPKDTFLLATGTAAMLICIFIGWRERRHDPTLLVAGTLAFEIAFYLARGSVILDFYIIPLIPLYALCIALVADRALKSMPASTSRFLAPAICAVVAAFLLLPSGGYLIKHGTYGQLQSADPYHVPLTFLQNEQIAWVRQHIPPNARIISDDDIWVALHDVRPYFPYDQSHWEAASDPAVGNKIFHYNWQNIDYIVLSNGMKNAMILNNTGGQEGYILNALDYHSREVWSKTKGSVSLAIYQVQK